MLLPRELVAYLSRQVVARLAPAVIDAPNPQRVTELVTGLIMAELDAEDQLNDEVREILNQYSEYMRREGVSYQEMFRKTKNQLIAKYKVVKAAGRDTGDAMKLSRDKITDISHKLVAELKKSRDVRVKKQPNEVRLEIVKAITDVLLIEERADRASRDKVKSTKREVPEGSEEFELMQKKYYAEEMKKLGIDLAH
jgi:uncharacterized protein